MAPIKLRRFYFVRHIAIAALVFSGRGYGSTYRDVILSPSVLTSISRLLFYQILGPPILYIRLLLCDFSICFPLSVPPFCFLVILILGRFRFSLLFVILSFTVHFLLSLSLSRSLSLALALALSLSRPLALSLSRSLSLSLSLSFFFVFVFFFPSFWIVSIRILRWALCAFGRFIYYLLALHS